MPAKRGRPLEFGRPTQRLTISLPADVVGWLKHLDPIRRGRSWRDYGALSVYEVRRRGR